MPRIGLVRVDRFDGHASVPVDGGCTALLLCGHGERGLNRIRHAWIELDPGMEPYLVSGFHDDEEGLIRSVGHAGESFGPWHALVTTPGMLAVIVGIVAAALAALLLLMIGASDLLAAAVGVVTFLLTNVLLASYQYRTYVALRHRLEERFPTTGKTTVDGAVTGTPNAERSGSL